MCTKHRFAHRPEAQEKLSHEQMQVNIKHDTIFKTLGKLTKQNCSPSKLQQLNKNCLPSTAFSTKHKYIPNIRPKHKLQQGANQHT